MGRISLDQAELYCGLLTGFEEQRDRRISSPHSILSVSLDIDHAGPISGSILSVRIKMARSLDKTIRRGFRYFLYGTAELRRCRALAGGFMGN